MNYRIAFSPNFLAPFTWKCVSFKIACFMANWLADFDLGRNTIREDTPPDIQRMISAYKAYKRSHSINHPDLIHTSTCTIDKYIDGQWYIVSEDLEEEDLDPYIEAWS